MNMCWQKHVAVIDSVKYDIPNPFGGLLIPGGVLKTYLELDLQKKLILLSYTNLISSPFGVN